MGQVPPALAQTALILSISSQSEWNTSSGTHNTILETVNIIYLVLTLPMQGRTFLENTGTYL